MCVLFSFDFPYDSACSRRETDLREREKGKKWVWEGLLQGKVCVGRVGGGRDCKSFVLRKVIVDGSAVARRH